MPPHTTYKVFIFVSYVLAKYLSVATEFCLRLLIRLDVGYSNLFHLNKKYHLLPPTV